MLGVEVNEAIDSPSSKEGVVLECGLVVVIAKTEQ